MVLDLGDVDFSQSAIRIVEESTQDDYAGGLNGLRAMSLITKSLQPERSNTSFSRRVDMH